MSSYFIKNLIKEDMKDVDFYADKRVVYKDKLKKNVSVKSLKKYDIEINAMKIN